jgi:ATP-dependent 26S proteasome regulatory subunit
LEGGSCERDIEYTIKYWVLTLFQAGMHAVRENRYIVLAKDFEKGYKNNIKKDESEHEFYK